MSYIRKFQRKHILQELKQQEKKEKSNKRAWGYSALAAMTTISLLVPSMASAAVDGVVRSDGGVKDVTENRADVYVGKMIDSNKTGVNTFSQFDVKANEVVNMHFNQKGGADVANNVINIVDSKINVSGTVNAIKNNKVGGNLYFLSSQGMAVTQSGVINAGSLHAFAPSSAEIQALKDDVAAGNAAVANKYIDYTVHRPNAGTMTSGPDSAYNVSLNPTGSIVVKGKINTYGDVGLHAANVQIGGTDSDATEKTAKGIITTGVTDFSSLVNVTNVEGSNLPTIDGNTGATELQAMQLGNGDIVLEARAAKQVADSTADPAGGEAANKLYIPFLGNLSSPDLLEKQSFNAKVTINGTLDAAQSTNGSIKVDAIARNESNTALVGVDATVDVVSGSVLHAKKDVDVKASALNIYIEKDNAKTKADFDPTDTGSGTGIDAIGPKALSGLQDLVALPKLTDASIAILNSNATVNIGTDAALTADTGDVSVGARSDLMTVMGPQKPTFLQRLADMITMPTVANAQLPSTGVTLLFGDNNATVNINGQLKATAGNVNVDSLARMDANAYNNNTQRSEISDSAKYNLSLTYADLANTSKVTVADTAKLTASQDVNVKARSIENVDTDVSINVNENAGLATVLNLTKFNSTTKTDFNGTTTGRNVTIASDRKVYELTATADASIGANDLYKQVARGFEAGSKGLLTSIKGALGSTGEDGQSPLSLGAAVGYYDIHSTVDDYLAANQTYQDMLKTPTYVWSERDMLYALNRDITNPERGSTQSEALQNKKPNISGKNVNIYAQGIGKDSANPEVIMAKGLFDNETNLRRLANVDVSNITTNFATVTKPDGGTEKQIVSFTIDEKIAVGLNATGRLNVKTTGDNAYIAARSNSGASGASSLSVGTVDTNNHDIRLFALAGIQNGLSDLNAANFTGKNLLVEGGAGSNGAIVNIGSHEKPLVVNLTGDIEARTGSSESQTYFNAGRLIRLNVNGSDVGTAENPLDIMANGSAVSVYGADDVYLNGINSNKAGSKLILGDVRPAGQLSVSSETDIQVGRDEFDRVASDGTTVHEDAVPGIVVVKDDLNLTANNVIINGQVGVLSDPADPATVIPGKTVTLIAKKGTVSETEKGQVLTNTLVAQAVKGITMNSEQNVFNAVKFGAYTPGQALDGNVTIKTSSDSLTLANISDTNKPTVDGNIYVENVKDGGTMDVSATLVAHKVVDDLGQVVDGRLGLITLIAKGNVANTGNINSNDDVILRSDYGTVTAAGSINSLGVVSMTGKTGAVAAGSITSGDDKDITIYSETGPVDVSAAITAGKNVTITTSGIAATDETAGVAGDVTVNGSITAKNGKAVINTSLGDVHVAGILSAANGDAAIHTTDGDVGVDGTVTATNGNAEITTTNGNVRIGAAGEANSGTVTGNNVTVTTTAGKMDIHGNVTANTGDVTLGTVYTGTDPANGAISVDGNVTAAQAVAATTNVGNILFDGNVKGTDVTMATNVGTITVTGNTEATTGAVSATTNATDAEKGAINFNGTVTGKTDVTATTKSGAITFTQAVTATDNNVSANTVDGAISFNGETNAGNDITAKATNTGSISFAGNANAANNVTATTNTGTVTFNGNTTAESGSVTATTVDGTITFNGNTQAAQDVTATATNNGAITVTDGHTVNAGHDVTATAKNGNIDFGGTVTATNLLKATNENGDILFKGSASGADVAMATQSGNISVTGDTTATTGSVTASTATTEAGKGAINFNGTVTGKTDVTATTKSGSITFNNAVTATDNNVTANTVDGAIAFNGNTKAGNDVAVNATNTGSITFNGNTDTAHDVTANANLGAVTFNGNTTAANDIGVNTNVGAVTFNGNTAADHDVTVDTNVGAITFNGDTSAARDVVANTNAGSITTTAGHSLKAGNDITATAQDGDISFAGAVQAGENVKATTQNTGNIEFNGAVEAVNKDILAKTNTGNVTVKKDIAANQNINVYTKNGSIVFGGNAENPTKDVYATAKNGSIYLTVDQTGDIKDTHREMNGYSARLRAGQDSPVDNPNVIISQNGIGTVDLAEITAKQAANIRTENGTIHIGHLDGQVVAVVGRDDVSKVVVDQLNAGQQVNIEANDVTIKAMKQLPDSTVPLTVSTMGDAPNKPMSSLVIEDIQTENGVVFPHLWLNTGAITTTKGAMDITKYYVLDKAQISNGNMITNIYGTAPIREPKTMSTYWNDTGINNPLQDMTGWYAAGNNPKWAFIRYENQGNRQIANGHLLSLDEHYYAYNQRYTVEDEMRRMSTPKLQDFYPHYYNPDLAYYNRFESAVITGNPVKVNNAKDDEILIEAAAEVNG